jgi:probable blue pigment (indigoidine) exporter
MRWRTPGLYLLVGLLWGGSFVAIDAGLPYFPPMLFAGIRYLLAGVFVLGYAVLFAGRWRPASLADLASVAAAGVFIIAGHHAFLYLAIQHISGAVASIVVSLSPVLTAVFAGAMLSESDLTVPTIAGVLFGFAGVVVLSDIGFTGVASTNLLGLGLALLATVSFAFGSVAGRPVRTDLPVSAMQGWAMLLGAGLLGVTAAATGESAAAITWAPVGVASLVFLVIGPGTVAFLLYFRLLDQIGPMETNLIAYLEPVVATLLSWVLLGEVIDATTVVGFLSIFVGFVLVKHRVVGPRVRALVPDRSGSARSGPPPSESSDAPAARAPESD